MPFQGFTATPAVLTKVIIVAFCIRFEDEVLSENLQSIGGKVNLYLELMVVKSQRSVWRLSKEMTDSSGRIWIVFADASLTFLLVVDFLDQAC
jgi:hypothetical protein